MNDNLAKTKQCKKLILENKESRNETSLKSTFFSHRRKQIIKYMLSIATTTYKVHSVYKDNSLKKVRVHSVNEEST